MGENPVLAALGIALAIGFIVFVVRKIRSNTGSSGSGSGGGRGRDTEIK